MTIIDEPGAEKLSGDGELYFKYRKNSGIQYIQGANFESDEDEIEMMLNKIRLRYDNNKSPEKKEHDFSLKFVITKEDLERIEAETFVDLINVSRHVPKKRNASDTLFAQIVVYVLGYDEISSRIIEDSFHCGSPKAKSYLEKMFSWGVISELYAKQPRKVKPTCYEDLSVEVISFLNSYGYTEENIREAFKSRGV
jgi:DNA segregation ATPase FtsK/SpoIIIE-like protein